MKDCTCGFGDTLCANCLIEELHEKADAMKKDLKALGIIMTDIPCPDCGSRLAKDYNGRTLNVCAKCQQFVPKFRS